MRIFLIQKTFSLDHRSRIDWSRELSKRLHSQVKLLSEVSVIFFVLSCGHWTALGINVMSLISSNHPSEAPLQFNVPSAVCLYVAIYMRETMWERLREWDRISEWERDKRSLLDMKFYLKVISLTLIYNKICTL